jgi:hypothetical protein
LGDLARPRHFSRVHGIDSLLSADRSSTRTAALAGQCVAKAVVVRIANGRQRRLLGSTLNICLMSRAACHPAASKDSCSLEQSSRASDFANVCWGASGRPVVRRFRSPDADTRVYVSATDQARATVLGMPYIAAISMRRTSEAACRRPSHPAAIRHTLTPQPPWMGELQLLRTPSLEWCKGAPVA